MCLRALLLRDNFDLLAHPQFEKNENQQKFTSPSARAIHFETATVELNESNHSAQKYLIRELNHSAH
jgi:hypothetical protein